MRLAPAQTNYKLKIVNRVEESVMRKSRVQKIACENWIEEMRVRRSLRQWQVDHWWKRRGYNVLHESIGFPLPKGHNLRIGEALSSCPWGSPSSETVFGTERCQDRKMWVPDWVLVWSGLELATSRSADRGSPNWANQAAVNLVSL